MINCWVGLRSEKKKKAKKLGLRERKCDDGFLGLERGIDTNWVGERERDELGFDLEIRRM